MMFAPFQWLFLSQVCKGIYYMGRHARGVCGVFMVAISISIHPDIDDVSISEWVEVMGTFMVKSFSMPFPFLKQIIEPQNF